MNRLQKFIEQGAYGEKSGRIAYAFGPSKLPQPGKGMEWRIVSPFSAAEEVFKDEALRGVFKSAIESGCAIVTRG
jgi:hypothetical protein